MALNFIILLAISSFWGFAYLFVKVAEESFSPMRLMVGRALISGVTLILICLVLKKDLLRPLVKYRAFILFSIVGITIPWLGIAYSEEYISSGLAAAMSSSMPIFTLLMTVLVLKAERFTKFNVAGVTIALIGLFLVIGIDNILGEGSTVLGTAMILGAFFCYSVNSVLVSVYAKEVDPLVTITYTIGFGAVLLIILMFIFEKYEIKHMSFNYQSVFSLLTLGVFSTALAFSGFYLLIKRAGPFFPTLLGYIAPVFGIIAGVIFLHESIDYLQALGIVLVLLGIILINKTKFGDLTKHRTQTSK